MKRRLFFGLIIIIVYVFTTCQRQKVETIKISGAWALYPMMCVWAEEYQKIYDVKIEVTGGGAGKGISDVLNGQVDIAMVSRPIKQEELDLGAFYLAVTKDAVIATINAENPIREELFARGISRQELQAIFMKDVTRWGELIGKDLENDNIVVYGRADASGAAKVWASYLGDYSQADLQGKADANFSGDQALCNGVKDKKNAIGFNNLNYAYDMEKGCFATAICPVPIDLNGDQILNPGEDFYTNRSDLVNNVSDGTYPAPPSRLEYLVGKSQFSKEAKKFISWIMTDGQQYIKENGYVELPAEDLTKELKYLEIGYRE